MVKLTYPFLDQTLCMYKVVLGCKDRSRSVDECLLVVWIKKKEGTENGLYMLL